MSVYIYTHIYIIPRIPQQIVHEIIYIYIYNIIPKIPQQILREITKRHEWDMKKVKNLQVETRQERQGPRGGRINKHRPSTTTKNKPPTFLTYTP